VTRAKTALLGHLAAIRWFFSPPSSHRRGAVAQSVRSLAPDRKTAAQKTFFFRLSLSTSSKQLRYTFYDDSAKRYNFLF
jgi:hypothetical protein